MFLGFIGLMGFRVASRSPARTFVSSREHPTPLWRHHGAGYDFTAVPIGSIVRSDYLRGSQNKRNHKKELLWSLWVGLQCLEVQVFFGV